MILAVILLFIWLISIRRDITFVNSPFLFTYSKVWLSLLVLGVLVISFGYDVYFVRKGYDAIINKMLILAISSVILSLLIKRDKLRLGFWNPSQDIYLILLIIFFLFIIIYVSFSAKRIPLFYLFSDNSSLMSARFQSKFNFSGNVYLKNLVFGKLIKFTCLVAYARYLLRPSQVRRIVSILLILFASYAELFDGEKAPFVFLLISLAIVRFLIRGVNTGSLIKSGTLAFATMFVFYTIIEDGSTAYLLESMFNRAALVPVAGLLLTINYFPNKIEFLHGASFPQWMISPFGLEHKRSARAVMEIFNPDGVEGGTAGVINSWYQAEAFANFGFVAALISPMIIIPFLYIIRSAVSSYSRSVQVGLIAFLFFEVPYFGGFVELLWNVKIMFILTMAFLLSLKISK